MKTYFSFCHDYHKLREEAFTTIRGATAAKQYKVGQVVDCIAVDGPASHGKGRLICKAEIVGLETKPLSDIAMDVLQRDASYGRYCPKSHWDFVGLINSLRPYDRSKIKDLSEEVTVFQLFKA